MYARNDLYKRYKENLSEAEYSSDIPDVTKKRTLDLLNTAINCAEDWNSALDIGGGNGHYSLSLVHKFKQVHLVEPTKHKEHSEISSKYTNYIITNKLIEETNLDIQPDFIMLSDLFEHIVDIEAFVKHLRSVQSKGGVVYVLTPNPLFCGPATQSEIHNSKIGIYGHERHYFPHEIIDIFRRNTYDLIFQSYEETPIREHVRRIIRGVSRRHKKLSAHLWYRFLPKWVLMQLSKPVLAILERLVYYSEVKHKNNPEISKSVVYVFKKNEA